MNDLEKSVYQKRASYRKLKQLLEGYTHMLVVGSYHNRWREQ